ncbi:MAG: hypothetical protein JNL83_33885 [Myxococcales bacterium]|nr:hypothetical protein [Myxococcales bacterium]
MLVAARPAVASAKPKIALTAIDGDDSGAVGDAVTEALDGDALTVISQRVVNKAVDKLGLDNEMTEKQAKKLAGEVEADAIVIAKLDKDGGHKRLHFKLYVHGKKARGFKVIFNNAKSDRFKSKLRDKMVTKIAGETKGGGGDDDDEMPKGKGKGKGEGNVDDEEDPLGGKKDKKLSKKSSDEEDEEDEEAPKKKKKRTASAEDEDDEEIGVSKSVSSSPKHSANRVAARLDLGVSFKNRQLLYNSRADFPEGPKPFKVQPVPGARFEAELYPLAFANPKSIAAGLGFAAEYDKTILLTLRTTDEPNVPVKANQQAYSFGVRLRFVLGSTDTSPSITLGAGYGKRRFTTDRSGLMDATSLDIPETNYTTLDPGLSIRIPLIRQLALTFGGRALIITDAGPVQQPTSYGRAKVFGAWASGGIDIVLGNRFAIRLTGEFQQVGFAFTGTGDLARNRDMDPDTKDVGGMSDRSIGGSATLAVLY